MKGLSFFSSITEGVTRLTSEATKAKDKFLEGQTQAEQISFTSLWEAPEPVEYCRECAVKFQLIKHHCRSCAGVFCDDCCPQTVPNSYERSLIPPSLNLGSTEAVRICRGCRRGECPSRVLKEKVRHMLDEEAGVTSSARSNRVGKFQARVGAKLEEAVNQLGDVGESTASNRRGSSLFSSKAQVSDPLTLLASLPLKRGSYYGENHMMKKAGSKPLAVSGYFEIFNKSREIFALKVLRNDECNSKFEIPRPSFLAIPPNEAVYGFFDPEKDRLAIVVLFKNPNKIPSDKAVVYDTRAPGTNPSRISGCARIDQMEQVQVYMADSVGKNVLLKYKGSGIVQVREGTSADRVGFFGYLQGRRFNEGMLDFQTNIDRLHVSYSIH